MSSSIGKYWIIWAALGAVALLLIYAAVDGGREPLRNISQPVAVPEIAR